MEQNTYKVGDLKRIISESTKEFKPVLGKNVDADNKQNNSKSYKDAMQRTKAKQETFDEENKGDFPQDDNMTTLSYNPATKPSKETVERFKAQSEGYSSVQEKNNKIEKAAHFDKKGKLIKGIEDKNKAKNDANNAIENAGLTSAELAKSGYKVQKNSLTENSVKRYHFKKTTFQGKEHLMSLIPECAKIEGKQFLMKDNKDNEYLIEWQKIGKETNICEGVILKYENKTILKEEMSRINKLFNYNSSDYFKNNKGNKEEESKFTELLHKTKKINS